MSALQIVTAVTVLAASGVVAIRLLILARHTRGQPELLMGLGLASNVFVYLPARAHSGIGRGLVGEVDVEVLAVGSLFLWFGITCMIMFTWRTFRPGDRWAAALTAVLSLWTAAAVVGLITSLYASPPDVHSLDASHPWISLVRVPVLASYLWTGVEGFHQYGQAKRRLTLGIGNVVVVNRFLLWGMYGVTHCTLATADLVLQSKGADLMASPGAMSVLAAGSVIGTAIMLLVFFPPAAYLEFVRRRPALAAA